MSAGTPNLYTSNDRKIYFDVSRLSWRCSFGRPTGIDRVELNYAKELLGRNDDLVEFVIYSPACGIRRLPHKTVQNLIYSLEGFWAGGKSPLKPNEILGPVLGTICRFGNEQYKPNGAYLNISGFPLWRERHLRLISSRMKLKPFVFVHDIIPVSHPEYVPNRWENRTKKFLRSIDDNASGIIGNSAYTIESIAPFLTKDIPALHIPLGIIKNEHKELHILSKPFFLCVGTIEPRKNHITLLHVWRELASHCGDNTPKLVIIGRIGWKCDHIISLINESPALKKHVEFRGWRSDQEVHSTMRSARAVLAPSFVEGYDLPLAEALANKIPCICSDIPAHREVAGDIPEYVHPIDAKGWMQAIKNYTNIDSTYRKSQIKRAEQHNAPTWKAHVEKVINFIIECKEESKVKDTSPRNQVRIG